MDIEILTPELVNEVASNVANILVPVALAIVSYAATRLTTWLRANTTAKQYAWLEGLAAANVAAAQQLGITGEISNIGSEKYRWVTDQIGEAMRQAGINLPGSAVRAIVEAAVKKVKADEAAAKAKAGK